MRYLKLLIICLALFPQLSPAVPREPRTVNVPPASTRYSDAEMGFRVLFPSPPERVDQTVNGTQIRSFQSTDPRTRVKFSVFFNIEAKKLLDASAIDAYLEHFTDQMTQLAGLKVVKRQRLEFSGFPGLLFETTSEGQATRSIVFVCDGDSIRLSVLYPTSNFREPPGWSEFVESFELLPLDPVLSSTALADQGSGLSMGNPVGWQQRTSRNPSIRLMSANPSGHSVMVSLIDGASYSCSQLEAELPKESIVGLGDIQLLRGRARWLKSTTFNPTAGIRMSTIYLCEKFDNHVLLVLGTAPDHFFFRSEEIFRAVAKSVRISR